MSNNDFWMGYTAGSGNVEYKKVKVPVYVYRQLDDAVSMFSVARRLLSFYSPDDYAEILSHTRNDDEGYFRYKDTDSAS
jgi:hypothetical protein